MRSAVLAVVVAVGACGPSAAEIRTARTATYVAEPGQVMQAAEEAAQGEGYKIGEVDESAHAFATVPRWYSPEGGLESQGAGGYVNLQDKSVEVSFVVEVVPGDAGQMVTVTPHTRQYLAGSPQPRELTPDDPNLPPFVKGRADSLQLAIYNHAKPLAAK